MNRESCHISGALLCALSQRSRTETVEDLEHAYELAATRINTSGYGYDANGNMTNDGMNTLVYDAENHAVSGSGSLGSGTYTYDGNGLRVNKVSGSATTVYVFSGSKVIAECDNCAAPPSRN